MRMSNEEKFVELIGEKKLLRKPFSEETKDQITAMAQKIGSRTIAKIGAEIERDLRNYQLMKETGRLRRGIIILPASEKTMEKRHRNANRERARDMLREERMSENRQWIWQVLWLEAKTNIAELPDSFLEREPPLRYIITCECGETTEVEAIGPLSALAKAQEFPIDDFGRFKFWNHKYGCMTTADEQCYCYEELTVKEI